MTETEVNACIPNEGEKTNLAPGTLVFCKYRSIWVGTIEEPGDDPAQWNQRNSERVYCETCKVTRVRYEWGVMHDTTSALIPITPEVAALTPIERVELLLGKEAR